MNFLTIKVSFKFWQKDIQFSNEVLLKNYSRTMKFQGGKYEEIKFEGMLFKGSTTSSQNSSNLCKQHLIVFLKFFFLIIIIIFNYKIKTDFVFVSGSSTIPCACCSCTRPSTPLPTTAGPSEVSSSVWRSRSR
jgi:hypothetical protein